MKSITLPLLSCCALFAQTFPLDSLDALKLNKVSAQTTSYIGRAALHVTEPKEPAAGEDKLVVLTKTQFRDGVIELDLAGKPGAGAAAAARGFVGIAFRVAPDLSKFECFYLRPTNGRAEDQERRNHSVQYTSFPDYPWQRTRKETPSKYETYADLVPGEWTKLRLEVRGLKARLYVNGVQQPTLIVNDLKLGETSGHIALWIGPGTDAYFANLRVSP
ncbi:MAG: DUF1080 domain-containing protein [Acidimicrobiia bacterium]|nr:DUF1080 domain-containing protein [Acidimicrobiia bacterium]